MSDARTETRIHDRLQMSEELVARKNQDGTVIVMKLDDSAVFFKIDGIAASVWSDLGQKPTTGELISQYRQKYPENADTVEKDILAFLDELLQKKLILTSY